MYTIRSKRKYLIEFLPEIPLVDTGDPIGDIEKNTQNYTSAIESMVRKAPEQYFWVHNRWKTPNFCPLPRSTAS
jgi:KDO2-lipid IV(A) lauroyltransferase